MTKKAEDEATLWLGSMSSYMVAAERQQSADLAMTTSLYGYDQDEDEDDEFQGYGDMVQRIGDTALVSVSGPLIPRGNWLTRAFGLTAYDDVSNAVNAAASAEGIKQILLDIDSPGGAVNGLDAAAQNIRAVDEKVMPVYAHTGGSMTSAAYWLGSSARKVYSTEMASVGSIGVIAVHQEVSKMLRDQGIGVTVFRSGPRKALGGAYEPLSAEAKEVIQDRIDSLADHFMSVVADNRGRTTDYIRAHAGDGREFFGREAEAIGLVDGLNTLEEVVKLIDNDHNSHRADGNFGTHTGAETMLRKRKVMTPEAQAAMAAGVPAATALEEHGQEVEESTSVETPETEATSADVDPTDVITDEGEEITVGAETPDDESEDEASSEEDTPAAATAPVATGSAEFNSMLKEMMVLQGEVAELRTKNGALTTQLESLQAVESGLKEATAAAINRMQIGLGAAATDLSNLDGTSLLAQYQSVNTQFIERFHIGAKAEVPVEEEGNGTAVDADGNVVSLLAGAARAATKITR